MASILTAAAVARLKGPKSGQLEIPDGGCRGLYLAIQASGAKTWALRYRRPVTKKPARLVIGRVSLEPTNAEPKVGAILSLASARRLAAHLSHQIADGHDPAAEHVAQKKNQTGAYTFDRAASDYVAHVKRSQRSWRDKASALGLKEGDDGEIKQTRGGLARLWANKPVAAITSKNIGDLIRDARRNGIPGLERRNRDASDARARHLHSILSAFFNWLKDDERQITASPMTELKRPKAPASRDRVLTAEEIKKFWIATNQVGEPFGSALKVMLLTGARKNEVAGMLRSELDKDVATWSLPGSRTKNKKPYAVPLSPLASKIITDAKSPSEELVFSTTGYSTISGWSKMKPRLDRLMGSGVPPFTIHDLRRTAVTHMAELGVRGDVIELCVNHVSGTRGGIAGVYNRSELMAERRAAMEAWSRRVTDIVEGRSTANIIDLRRGA
jgi:integrase